MFGGFMSCCISTRSKLNQSSTKYRQEKYSTSDIQHHWSHQQHKSHHLVLHQLEQSAEEQCDKVSKAKEFIILCGDLCQKQIFSQKGQYMKLKWNQELFFFTAELHSFPWVNGYYFPSCLCLRQIYACSTKSKCFSNVWEEKLSDSRTNEW